MIAAVIFVLAFLVLGLSVLFFAFSGRGGARTRRGAPSRAGRRFVAVMVTIVIIALGVAVPLAIGVVNGNDHAKNAPGGVDLNAAQTSGRAVFGKYCSTCHTLKASNAVGKVGPNLDVLHPPKGLILDAIAKGRARGQGQMPAGVVDGQDAQDVAAYVAAVAGRG
ncbi:MAG TPA: cytochrome c [Solirubrobacteraceae bacterium]|jgi:mono/diheme cytochrome c family protein